MYIFDEPSVGLHPRDVHRLNELLEKLRDKGNTVIVVEHDPDVIKVADYLVDMGPRAGSEGGQVVYEGDFAGLLKADTLTGNHLLHKRPLKETFRQASGVLPIVHATVNNLKDVSVDIPNAKNGDHDVAGSQSSLITEAFSASTRGGRRSKASTSSCSILLPIPGSWMTRKAFSGETTSMRVCLALTQRVLVQLSGSWRYHTDLAFLRASSFLAKCVAETF
jgi:excinuclease UvrABC ATPase subunit